MLITTTPKMITQAVLMAFLGAPLLASAAVHKCTGADGKVVFSDQPCMPGQSAAAVKDAVDAKPSSTAPRAYVAADASANAAMAAMRKSNEAALTPACRQIQADMERVFLSPTVGQAKEIQLRRLSSQFEAQCLPSLRNAREIEAAKSKLERDKQQKLFECNDKRRIYDERKTKLASMDENARQSMAKLNADITSSCN